MNRKRGLRRSQLIATGIAALLSLTFLITLVAPSAGSSTHTVTSAPIESDTDNTFQPTSASLNIENSVTYVHPTGLFQSYRPSTSTWQILQDSNTTAAATNNGEVVDVRFRGNQSCAVVHLLAEINTDYDSIDMLNNSMPNSFFNDAWSQYGSWETVSRTLENDIIQAEFKLYQPPDFSSYCPDTYRARSVSWITDGVVHHVRMVVREDDNTALNRLQELFVPTFISYPHNIATIDNNWQVRTDLSQNAFFVAPPTWQRNALSDNERLIFEGTIGASDFQATLETVENTQLGSEEEARDFLTARIPSNAEVLSSATIQQPYGNGYRFSYTFVNTEGVSSSAIMTLLNDDTEGNLYLSEVRGQGLDIDLLAVDVETGDYVEVSALELAESLTIMLPSFEDL